MGMLDRIKKRQIDGLKEFVQSMETTGAMARAPIFTAGILEDPIFMSWVMKNLRIFDDFLKLPSDEIEAVFRSSDRIMTVFAKCMFGCSQEKITELERLIPKFMSHFKDEFNYIQNVSSGEQESARFFVLKSVRKLQQQDRIQGFSWILPPMDVFYPKTYKDGPGEFIFDTGIIAAAGEHLKGKRAGSWKHFYENGKLFAEGDYLEGHKSGKWIFYYGNGEKRSEGAYRADQKNGVWKEWDRSGSLSETAYIDGSRQV